MVRESPREPTAGAGISPFLYLAALAVTLCGVLTVTDSVGNSDFTGEAVLMTLVGFGFSLGCRALRIDARVLEVCCLGVIVLGVVGALTQRLDLGALLPATVTKNEDRVAVLLCWGAVLLSWALLHDWTTLFTPLLAVAAIGLVSSSDLNDYVAGYFCGFLVASAFLLIHYQALRLRALAPPAERAREGAGQPLTQLGLAALCALAVLGLAALLIVPLEAASRNLSLAGAIRQLATFAAPTSPNAGVSTSHFSDEADLPVGTGEGWSASAQVLMRVTPDDGRPHYWRGRTYDHYAGSGWESTLGGPPPAPLPQPVAEDDGRLTYPVARPSPPGRPPLSATFEVVGDTDEFYYAADPQSLTLPADTDTPPRIGTDGRLDLGARALSQSTYTVASRLPPDPQDAAVQDRLRRAGAHYPDGVRRLYLGNMARRDGTTDPVAAAYFRTAVRQALEGLPPGRRTPIDRALAIRDWVAGHCTYSLDVAAIPRRTDRVYEFLAHTRVGYCDLFASSMTVLCRVAGLPARLATGFAPGVPDGAAFDLRVLDKHAWTEVYFPGAGWLAFDPTDGTRTDGSVPNPAAAPAWDWHRALGGLGLAPPLLAALILGLLLYIAKAEWDARRLARRAGGAPARPRSDAGRRYARLTRLLAGLGLPRGVGETPGEYAARARVFLTPLGPDAPDPATVTALTAHLVAARYGGGAPADSPGAEAALRAFAAASLRLRWALLRARIAHRPPTSGQRVGPGGGMELNYAQAAAKGFPQPVQRVYLLHGSDDALKREALQRLTGPLLDPAFADFDSERREVPPTGGGADAALGAQILASAGGAPIASPRRVVVVEGVQRLGKEDQDVLAAGLEKLGALSCLVLVAGAAEYEAGKVKARTAVGTKLVAAAAKYGATVLCDAPAEGDLKARAAALLKARGKGIEPKALDMVLRHAAAVAADRGGGARTGDVTALVNELEKLAAHAGDRAQITLEDARAVGLSDPQENIFALCDAVGRRDPARALAEADELLATGDKPDAVAARTFVMLARHLRMLYGAKFLASRRIGAQNARALPPDVGAALSGEMLGLTQRQGFRLADLQKQAAGWTEPALAQALARVLASDLTMKGLSPAPELGAAAPPLADDPATNLRLLAVELCRET